jgi:hypothetical protein
LANADKNDVKYFLQEYVGEKIIKDDLNELFSIAPNHNEKTGDSWVRNIMLINKAPVKLSNMYTIKEIKDDSVYLTLNSVVSARAAENATPFMEGNGTGKITAGTNGIPYAYYIKTETKTTTNSTNYFKTEIFSATIK